MASSQFCAGYLRDLKQIPRLEHCLCVAKGVTSKRNNFSTSSKNYLSTSSKRKEIFSVIDKNYFEKKVMSDGNSPTIVSFSATWCVSCKILLPRLVSAVDATEGKVNLAFVDVDNLSDLIEAYDIRAVPRVLAIKDGQVVGKFIGLLEGDKLKTFIQKLL